MMLVTWCLEQIKKSELEVEEVDTSLNLSTMHSRKVIPVTRIDGLIVERPDRRVHVELPKAYARDNPI